MPPDYAAMTQRMQQGVSDARTRLAQNAQRLQGRLQGFPGSLPPIPQMPTAPGMATAAGYPGASLFPFARGRAQAPGYVGGWPGAGAGGPSPQNVTGYPDRPFAPPVAMPWNGMGLSQTDTRGVQEPGRNLGLQSWTDPRGVQEPAGANPMPARLGNPQYDPSGGRGIIGPDAYGRYPGSGPTTGTYYGPGGTGSQPDISYLGGSPTFDESYPYSDTTQVGLAGGNMSPGGYQSSIPGGGTTLMGPWTAYQQAGQAPDQTAQPFGPTGGSNSGSGKGAGGFGGW